MTSLRQKIDRKFCLMNTALDRWLNAKSPATRLLWRCAYYDARLEWQGLTAELHSAECRARGERHLRLAPPGDNAGQFLRGEVTVTFSDHAGKEVTARMVEKRSHGTPVFAPVKKRREPVW